MKKLVLSATALLFLVNLALAGGILTNSNQSAQFVRMLSRNASTDLDAVYFNPAGLVKMEDGFYLAFHNQSIFQTKTVNNLFPMLNDATYIGDVAAPVFPSFFANYKKDKFALSFGFGPNGGGGSAEYKTGLPSFEVPISQLPAGLNQLGIPVTGYSADLYFKGTSVFWGFQFNASYKVSEIFSASAGIRIIDAKNTYLGHIKDINVISGGQSKKASDLLTNLATQASGAASQFSQYPATMVMPDNIATGAGLPIGTTFGQAVTIMNSKAGAAQATANSLGDKNVDVKQKGTGITPILGVHIAPSKKLDIAIKYEFNTKLELENETSVDGTGKFPDGYKFRNDIPAILTAGVDYKILPDFKLSTSFNYYFDKNSNREGKESEIDKNYYEIAFGGQYDISEKVALSAGIMHSQTGVGSGYQTDLDYSLSSNTVGLGGEFSVTPRFTIDLGFLYTMYQDGEKSITYQNIGAFKETYDKKTTIFSVGFAYKIF